MKLISLASVQQSITIEKLSKNQLKDLQTALTLLGYPVGDIDGLIGPNTRSAWAKFANDISRSDPTSIDPGAVAILQNKVDELAARHVLPSEKIDKVIVSNLAALTNKYGDAGVQQIKQALQTLIEADKNRGFTTQILCPG
jgi:hypothetical protein